MKTLSQMPKKGLTKLSMFQAALTPPAEISKNYHDFKDLKKRSNLMPIYQKLKDYGVTFTVDSENMLTRQYASSKGIGNRKVGGYFDPVSKTLALASNMADRWWH